jgi:hypothetical protein
MMMAFGKYCSRQEREETGGSHGRRTDAQVQGMVL